MKKGFRLFLKANLDGTLFNNKQYYEALVKYFKSGVRPNEKELIIHEGYFEKSIVVVNYYEKQLDSRFDNMLKRIDIFKAM